MQHLIRTRDESRRFAAACVKQADCRYGFSGLFLTRFGGNCFQVGICVTRGVPTGSRLMLAHTKSIRCRRGAGYRPRPLVSGSAATESGNGHTASAYGKWTCDEAGSVRFRISIAMPLRSEHGPWGATRTCRRRGVRSAHREDEGVHRGKQGSHQALPRTAGNATRIVKEVAT